ncbi:MAG: hypothetical protein KDH20_11255 [Rhodocyclaceae bacterium]|nr:hypothetical protein [Rhodocyclaceae bacterium]
MTDSTRPGSRLATAAALLLSAILLAGCGPVYRTTHHFTLPDSQRGRECVNACQATRQQCEATAEYAYQQCMNREESRYQMCEARKSFEPDPKKGWDKPRCVNNCAPCPRPHCRQADVKTCDARYRDCYVSCGGTIETSVECTRNCDAD